MTQKILSGYLQRIKQMKKVMLQLIKFSIVGVIAAVIDVGVLVLLKELVQISVLLSSAISFCVSVTVNYILSMAFVFKSKEQNKIKEFIIFTSLSIGGLCLNQLILWVGVSFIDIHYLAVKVLAMIIVTFYNFITRKIILEKRV